MTDSPITARTIAWWPVHELVAPVLDTVGHVPTVGSLPWLELTDDDPLKWASVLDGGRRWALYLDARQGALADAAHDVAAGNDWIAVARNLQRRNSAAHIPRRSA